ncbi:MAG: hypothetical protein CK425_09770 [Parachlamydia sp.]|nr:MAG: hypothetical protein CK425_09770 [Parachlamydia sp.]
MVDHIREFIDQSGDLSNYQGFVVTPDDRLKVLKKGDSIPQGCKKIEDVKVVDAVAKYFKKNKNKFSRDELNKIHTFTEHFKSEKELRSKKSSGIVKAIKNFFSRWQNLVLIHKFTTSSALIKNVSVDAAKELAKIEKTEEKLYEKTDLCSAILRYDQKRVRELLELPKDELEAAFKQLEDGKVNGRNPLYLIVLVSSSKMTPRNPHWDVSVQDILDVNKKLGDKGFPIDVQISPSGSTPLHCAASQANIEALKVLLEAGASPTLADQKGMTALHRATQRTHNDPEKDAASPEIIKLLLEKGADPSKADKDGHTAAYYWELRGKHMPPAEFEKIQKLLN